LLNYESAYIDYIGRVIDRFIDEKIMYAELRPMLLDKEIPTDDGKRKVDNAGQMKLVTDAVAKKMEQLKAENRLRDFPFGLKIIYCTPRSIPPQMMEREMMECIQLKIDYPDLICGKQEFFSPRL